MARTSQINYQRVTFSFPKKVVFLLREKVGNQSMSKYVSELIEADLKNPVEDVDAFMQSLKDFRDNVEYKTDKSSLEILREIRYGKK